jgi:hypothetical protein
MLPTCSQKKHMLVLLKKPKTLVRDGPKQALGALLLKGTPPVNKKRIPPAARVPAADPTSSRNTA